MKFQFREIQVRPGGPEERLQNCQRMDFASSKGGGGKVDHLVPHVAVLGNSETPTNIKPTSPQFSYQFSKQFLRIFIKSQVLKMTLFGLGKKSNGRSEVAAAEHHHVSLFRRSRSHSPK